MLRRIALVFGLAAAGCGSDSDDHLTAEDVAAGGVYCCFENGAAAADAPAQCTTGVKDCVWSETYTNVDPAGRGTMCGYLLCR